MSKVRKSVLGIWWSQWKDFVKQHKPLFWYGYLCISSLSMCAYSFRTSVGFDSNSDSYFVGVLFGMFFISFLLFLGYVFGLFFSALIRMFRQKVDKKEV